MRSRFTVGFALVALWVSGCDRAEPGDPHLAPAPPAARTAAVAVDRHDVAPSGSKAAAENRSSPESAGSVSGATPKTPPDPPWFREDIWPGAKVEGEARGLADGPELMASQILLSLPAETTLEECSERFAAAVRPFVPNIQQEPTARGEGGRLTLRGDGDGYTVTIVCGLEQKKVQAYLGYQWTRPPGAELGGFAGPQ